MSFKQYFSKRSRGNNCISHTFSDFYFQQAANLSVSVKDKMIKLLTDPS